MKRKKKGFLPETKKRKKRKSEGTTQEEDAKPAATSGDQPPSTGKKRRRRKKAKVAAEAQVNGMPAANSPAPKPPIMNPSAPAKSRKLRKRKKKLSQVNGATPTSPVEPAVDKEHQQELPTKEGSGKLPQSALPQKKAKLSLAVKSPSLFQSQSKKKRAQRRKWKKP